jgi:hypothetical protein
LEKLQVIRASQPYCSDIRLTHGDNRPYAFRHQIAGERVTLRVRRCAGDAFLIVAPGDTIRDRLRVLLPQESNNIYDQLEPTGYRVLIAPKADQSSLSVSISKARVPSNELPLSFSPGDHTAMDAVLGAIARMPPPTPLFDGRPTL